jgi:putative membrane protein
MEATYCSIAYRGPIASLLCRQPERSVMSVVGLLIRLLVTTLAVLVANYLLAPTYFQVEDVQTALIFAVVLGLLNAVVRPILAVITFPLTILTLGLFLFVLNALMFWAAGAIVAGVHVGGFAGAFLGAVITTAMSAVVSHFIH